MLNINTILYDMASIHEKWRIPHEQSKYKHEEKER